MNSLNHIPEIILSGTDLSFYHAQIQFYTGLCLPDQPITSDSTDEDKRILVSSGSRSNTYPDYGALVDGHFRNRIK